MSADDAVDLLTRLRNVLSERTYFKYNTSLINPFTAQLNYIDNVLLKYKPTADDQTNILDMHGISILNSILEINSISNRFVSKFKYNANNCENKYSDEISGIDERFVSMMNDKGYDGNEELNRVKQMFTDFDTGETRVRPVRLQSNLYRDNITSAFDYHLLVYLVLCLETENDIYKKMRQESTNEYTESFKDVSSCRSSCVGLCYASCDESCYGCGASCSGECTAACGECAKSCTMTCNNNCSNGCSHDCNGCEATCTGCIANCSGGCGETCKDSCGKCDASCYGTTNGAVVTCGCGSACTTMCSTTCVGENTKPGSTSPDPDPPIVTTPDPTPRPNPSTGFSNSPSSNHPNGGYVSDGNGSGHWEYYGTDGNVYRSDTNSNINNSGGSNSSNGYRTPGGESSTHRYYKK